MTTQTFGDFAHCLLGLAQTAASNARITVLGSVQNSVNVIRRGMFGARIDTAITSAYES